MRYRDYYEAIGVLKEKLSILNKTFYDYGKEVPSEEFIKTKEEINKLKNQIEFYKNMRSANERFNQNDSKHIK